MDGSEKDKMLKDFIKELQLKNNVKFFFLPEWIDSIKIEKKYEGQSLGSALSEILQGSGIRYLWLYNYAVILVKDPTQAIQHKELIDQATLTQRKIERLIIGASKGKDTKQIVFQGQVFSSETKEPLTGATLFVADASVGGTTKADGSFELKLPPGDHILSVSYVNYIERVFDIQLKGDGSLVIELEENPTLLDEVMIQDKSLNEITTSHIGITQLSIKKIKMNPTLMGEADVIKQIQTLPGVSTAGEAASGFNVRGGSVDQNLVLYDGTPIFNSSHVFGFFSAFNSEALRDVNFYKGGIPAEYGGRVSSVLDIRSKEGDYEKWRSAGGFGLISSNLMVAGPIKKGVTSLAISGRTTYSNWITNRIRTNYADLKNSAVSFYDANFKLTHKFNTKTKIAFSTYLSHDFFRLKGDSSYSWNNVASSIRLDHQISKNLNSDLTISFGSYDYLVKNPNPYNGFDLKYQILYPSIKANFQYQYRSHHLSMGVQSTYFIFEPGTLIPSGSLSVTKALTIDKEKSIESAVYMGDAFFLSNRLFFDGGIRISMFNSFGPATISLYKNGLPREQSNRVDSIQYGPGEIYKTYFGVEPRISLRYSIQPNLSIKAGYNRMYQYLHLVTNTTSVTPVDVWQPSGYYFKPQYADQLSIGAFKSTKEGKYDLSIEGFYKINNNILDFKDGAQLILNKNIETDLLQGYGRSYGIEFSIAKNTGRVTGSINYTFSRSLRTISGPTAVESINHGNEYPSNFDQPHVINTNWKIALTKRIFFTGNFTYRTGRPITLPVAAYTVDNLPVAVFSDRNQYRIADYHRLDVALVFEGSLKRRKIWDGTLIFSVYNVYGRKNPFAAFYKENGSGVLVPYQLSIVGVAFPSITYTFKIN